MFVFYNVQQHWISSFFAIEFVSNSQNLNIFEWDEEYGRIFKKNERNEMKTVEKPRTITIQTIKTTKKIAKIYKNIYWISVFNLIWFPFLCCARTSKNGKRKRKEARPMWIILSFRCEEWKEKTPTICMHANHSRSLHLFAICISMCVF